MTYDITTLGAPHADGSDASAINAHGAVTGLGFSSPVEGVVWQEGVAPQTVTDPHGALLHGINDFIFGTADVVGLRGWNNTATNIPILVRNGRVTDLNKWVGFGIAADINNAGLICGSSYDHSRGYILNSVSDIPPLFIEPLPGDATSGAAAINQAGDVVGMSWHMNDNGTQPSRGFYYQNGNLMDLGEAAFIDGMNDNGQVCGSVGRAYPQNFSPEVWTIRGPEPVFTAIPLPPGFLGAHADGINNAGDVVGTCWTAETYDVFQSAYIFQNGVSTDLNTLIDPASGWHLEFADSINDKGQIVGSGYLNGAHLRTAFLLTPVAAPRLYGRVPGLIAEILFGIIQDGGGVQKPGGPVPPWELIWARMPTAKRDVLLGLALDELATHFHGHTTRTATQRMLLETVRGNIDQLIAATHTGRQAVAPPPQHPVRGQFGKSVTRFKRTGRTGY